VGAAPFAKTLAIGCQQTRLRFVCVCVCANYALEWGKVLVEGLCSATFSYCVGHKVCTRS
jgi:hypothetical protein